MKKAKIHIWLWALALSICAAEGFGTDEPTLDEAIRGLGSPSHVTRRRSRDFLWSKGLASEERLEKVADSEDPEVRLSARELLEQIRLGLAPNLSPRMVRKVKAYHSANREGKSMIVRSLMEAGPEAYEVLERLICLEENTGVAGEIFAPLLEEEQPLLACLVENRLDDLNQLLRLRALTGNVQAELDHVMTVVLLKRIDDERLKLDELRGSSAGLRVERLLARLLRSSGKWSEALELTPPQEVAMTRDLRLRGNLFSDLAQEGEKTLNPLDIQARLKVAAYHALAGNVQMSESLLEGLDPETVGDPKEKWLAAEGLMLLRRHDLALSWLDHTDHFRLRVDMLFEMWRFEDLGEISEEYDWHMLAKWIQVGDVAEVRRLHQKLSEVSRLGYAQTRLLMRAALFLGERGVAEDLALSGLTRFTEENQQAGILMELLPEWSDLAVLAWRTLGAREPDHSRRLKGVQDFLSGASSADSLSQWGEALVGHVRSMPVTEQRHWTVRSLELMKRRWPEGEAMLVLEKSLNPQADGVWWLEAGTQAIREKQWLKADRWLQIFLTRHPLHAFGLILQGVAAVELGEGERGEALIRRGRLVLLGREAQQVLLLQELQRVGIQNLATAQRELLLGCIDPDSWRLAEMQREQACWLAREKRDFAAAADLGERSLLHCLEKNVQYVDISSYFLIPSEVETYHALDEISRGLPGRAVARMLKSAETYPGGLDGFIDVVVSLERAGHDEQADQLFDTVYRRWLGYCERFPERAHAHNGLAWLAARCHRELDVALKHARRAVELVPQRAAYLDTLATVYFHHGDREQAVEVQSKALQGSKDDAFIRAQLERFKRDPFPVEGQLRDFLSP